MSYVSIHIESIRWLRAHNHWTDGELLNRCSDLGPSRLPRILNGGFAFREEVPKLAAALGVAEAVLTDTSGGSLENHKLAHRVAEENDDVASSTDFCASVVDHEYAAKVSNGLPSDIITIRELYKQFSASNT